MSAAIATVALVGGMVGRKKLSKLTSCRCACVRYLKCGTAFPSSPVEMGAAAAAETDADDAGGGSGGKRMLSGAAAVLSIARSFSALRACPFSSAASRG